MVEIPDQLEYLFSTSIALVNQWHATLITAFGDQLPYKEGMSPNRRLRACLVTPVTSHEQLRQTARAPSDEAVRVALRT